MSALAPDSPWTRRLVGALTGLTAAAVALGVTELVAGLNRNWRSPVIDVGDRVVDNVPVWLKDFAIEQFGTNDKPVLLASIGAILVVYAMVVVALAFTRRLAIGVIGFGLFGLIGAYAAAASLYSGIS